MRPLRCLFLMGLLFCVGGRVFADDDETPGRKLAFLVGVTQYDHENLTPLRFPENDVIELGETLREQGYEVTVLTKTTGKKERALRPTAANIRAGLKKALTDVTRRDLIVIGLAGHGLQLLDQDESYFCPSDANPSVSAGQKGNRFDKPETLISMSELLETLGKSGIGEKLILVDACRNDPTARGLTSVKMIDLPSQTGMLLSCSAGEAAYESEKLGKGHGVFFYHVIQGLRKEAVNNRGEVTWGYLTSYVQGSVPGSVEKLFVGNLVTQSPHTRANLRGVPRVLARVTLPSPIDPLPAETPDAGGPAATEPAMTERPSGRVRTGPKPGPLAAPCGPSEARDAQALWAKFLGKQPQFPNTIGMTMAVIPPGSFGETGESDRPLMATHPFYMSTSEVTQMQWESVMGTRPWAEDGEVTSEDDRPAVHIPWTEANAFCEELTKREREVGLIGPRARYRLPTEAEWEWAARGGTEGLLHCGKGARLSEYEWFRGSDEGTAGAQVVGLKKPNPFGLRDTLGNVAEWCADRGGDAAKNPFLSGEDEDALTRRVVRGASWRLGIRHLRVTARGTYLPKGNDETGFRPVLVE